MTERPVGEAPRTEACHHLGSFSLMVLADGSPGVECDDCREAFTISRAYEREAAAAPPEPPRPDERRTPDTCSHCGAPGFRVVSHKGSGSVRFERVAAPEGLSLDVERLAEAIDHVVGDLRVVGEAGDIAAEYARLSPSSGESGSPPAIDEDRLFEALSFLGEDDILADGSLWKIKEIALNAALEYNRVGSGSPGEDR